MRVRVPRARLRTGGRTRRGGVMLVACPGTTSDGRPDTPGRRHAGRMPGHDFGRAAGHAGARAGCCGASCIGSDVVLTGRGRTGRGRTGRGRTGRGRARHARRLPGHGLLVDCPGTISDGRPDTPGRGPDAAARRASDPTLCSRGAGRDAGARARARFRTGGRTRRGGGRMLRRVVRRIRNCARGTGRGAGGTGRDGARAGRGGAGPGRGRGGTRGSGCGGSQPGATEVGCRRIVALTRAATTHSPVAANHAIVY